MDALAGQYIRQAYARSQHLYPDLARLSRRALLFNDLQSVRSAVVGDDNSRVSHGMAISQMALGLSEKRVTVSVIRLTISHPVSLELANSI